MNFSKNNLIKILPIISSVCLLEGCVPRNADGTYPSTYSYHSYNKLYKSKKASKPKRIFHASHKPKIIYRKSNSYRPKRVYTPKKIYTQRRPNHIEFPKGNFFERVPSLHHQVENIAKVALSQMGKTYSWGATGPFEFDCSGFTQFVYKQNGISLPRVSKDQAQEGEFIERENLKRGDLIFFSSSKSDDVHHVGIYLGDNRFIHASSAKKRVTISNLNENYYTKHFKWGRRLIEQRDNNMFALN
jgi:cell wall-associated NlpC family hydrolase